MSSLKVLIVEDSPTVRMTIRHALTQEGTPGDHVWEADSASLAMRAFDERHPEVVFIDITLAEAGGLPVGSPGFLDFLSSGPRPYEGGHQVARAMLARNPKLKVVVCTGNPPDDPRVRELIKAGAFTLLSKPIRLAQVREVLRALRDESAAEDLGSDASPGPV